MGYVGSYVWTIRQKVGSQRIITSTVNVLAVNSQGKIKLVYANHFRKWMVPGGHVELGDSFQQAALNELREESGIIASKDDLELFMTISGPGRVIHYADGDTTPMTLIFLCRNWQQEGDKTDIEEISNERWTSLDEARQLDISSETTMILDAYEEYLKTGKVQMIEVATGDPRGEMRGDYK